MFLPLIPLRFYTISSQLHALSFLSCQTVLLCIYTSVGFIFILQVQNNTSISEALILSSLFPCCFPLCPLTAFLSGCPVQNLCAFRSPTLHILRRDVTFLIIGFSDLESAQQQHLTIVELKHASVCEDELHLQVDLWCRFSQTSKLPTWKRKDSVLCSFLMRLPVL